MNISNKITYTSDEFHIDFINIDHKAFSDPKSLEVCAVFLDISKTFDKVWHDGLLFKLKQNGISGDLLKLFKNYLHNRKQRVALNGSYSDYSSAESGVPQGSVLGPLLFLVYINDLESNINSNINIFCKWYHAFFCSTRFCKICNRLKSWPWYHSGPTIGKWNLTPTPVSRQPKFYFLVRKIGPIFNGSAVVKVNEQKHLGLILEQGLLFDKHFSEKIIKAKRNIAILKYLSKFLPLRTLDQMYKALVRSHLDYCDVIYHIPSITYQPPLGMTLRSLMEKVGRVQYQAALVITGAWQDKFMMN